MPIQVKLGDLYSALVTPNVQNTGIQLDPSSPYVVQNGQIAQNPAFLNQQQQAEAQKAFLTTPGNTPPLTPTEIANAASDAASKAVGEATGKAAGVAVTPLSPAEQNLFGATQGQTFGGVTGKTADLSPVDNTVLDKYRGYASAQSNLEGLVPFLNDQDVQFGGSAGPLQTWLRSHGISLPGNQKADQFSQAAKVAINALKDTYATTDQGSARNFDPSIIPSQLQSRDVAQSNYESLKKDLQTRQINLLRQFPNQAANLTTQIPLQFSSQKEADQYKLPAGTQANIWDGKQYVLHVMQ